MLNSIKTSIADWWYYKLTIRQRHMAWAYIFLFIPLIFYLVIRIYPVFQAFQLSVMEWDLVGSREFVGLDNFRELFEDGVFWRSLRNTGKYLLGLPISLLIGFIFAYLLNKIEFAFSFFRLIYFLPYLTSLVAVAWIFRWILQPLPLGLVNRFLSFMGFSTYHFLENTRTALPSILAATIWQGLGFQIIIYLAGLKGIPGHLYEAAKIDGANEFQQLFKITIPLLKPTFVFLIVIGTIRYLRMFTQVLNMSSQGRGGPAYSTITLVLFLYRRAFNHFEMGYAAASTLILFVIIMVVSLIQLKVLSSND